MKFAIRVISVLFVVMMLGVLGCATSMQDVKNKAHDSACETSCDESRDECLEKCAEDVDKTACELACKEARDKCLEDCK